MSAPPRSRELRTRTVELPWSRPPLTSNQRLHWAKRAKLTKQIRYATSVLFHTFGPVNRCEVTMIWYVTDAKRRDVDNTVPTLKACCDGIIDAKILPDDTPNYMTKHMPQIIRTTGRMHITLTLKELP